MSNVSEIRDLVNEIISDTYDEGGVSKQDLYMFLNYVKKEKGLTFSQRQCIMVVEKMIQDGDIVLDNETKRLS